MGTDRLDINFFDPVVIEDPFGYYEEVRSAGRVVRNDVLQVWMMPGYDDCKAVLSDPVRFSNAHYRDPARSGGSERRTW